MLDTDWPRVIAATVAIIALLVSAAKLADWWMRRLELDAGREADVEERGREVAGE